MPCYPNAKGLLCMIVYQCYKQTYYDEGTEILEKAELTVISICNGYLYIMQYSELK